jgi:glucosylglycerol-phosphate synthase
MDESIEKALFMDSEAQRDRMTRMCTAVENYTVKDWAEEQLAGCEPPSTTPE